MRRMSCIIIVFFLFTLPPAAQAQLLLSKLPAPCFVELPKIYLVIDGTRRHIVDWDTFLNLGYKSSDIIQCGGNSKLPEGAPITQLIKGSSDEVYWMKDGVRHHIPDMPIFDAMGFKLGNITVLPDTVVALWALGDPLPKQNASGSDQKVTIGRYTIRINKPTPYDFFATISAPGQQDVRIAHAISIGQLPVADINGDGAPDVLILTWFPDGGTSGTVVYSLGATPTKILDVGSVWRWINTGTGEFKDLNGDGIYEFVTLDPPVLIQCPALLETVVLRYSAANHLYVAANPQFPAFYSDLLAQYAANPSTQCGAIGNLLYLDRVNEAQAIFDRLYQGTETMQYWPALQELVKQGRYYVPSH